MSCAREKARRNRLDDNTGQITSNSMVMFILRVKKFGHFLQRRKCARGNARLNP